MSTDADDTNDITDWFEETCPEGTLRLEPAADFDPCILGLVERFNSTFLVYDREAVIRVFEAQGMSEDDAEEYFSFNVLGGWLGDGTPGFYTPLTPPGGADTPPGHTCPAIDMAKRAFRRLAWRARNRPDATEEINHIVENGMAYLERVRAENIQLRAAYYQMKKRTGS